MKKFSKKSLPFLFFIYYLLFFIWPPSGHAQVKPLPTSINALDVVEISALETVFNNILAIATSLAGIAVFVVLIMGGFSWLTSGGDPKKVESAKNTITHALLGLVLLIVAWLILRFIAGFTGVDPLLKFTIPH